MPCLDTTIIRFIWSIVEKHSRYIADLSDDAIAPWLGWQVKEQVRLNPQETELIHSYILSRLILIRTIAESYQVAEIG
ncbi:MAG: hypothetical protein VKJ64_16190 [Leptolyngbyaceae bacterium]|nr:hypothetical protein [Leptolyngbyaceae bacterium]